MRDEASANWPEGSVVGELGLPVQVAPIARTPSGVALSGGSGVGASILAVPDMLDEIDVTDLVL